MKRLLLLFFATLPLWAQAPTTANLWIDTNGGTCTRQSTAGAYSDAGACSSIQAALTAASAGDVVVMKSGSYGGAISITANKSTPGVVVQCENANWDTPLTAASASKNSCKIGTSGGSLTTSGSWYTLKDITFEPGDARGSAWEARCSNCNFVNFNVHGDFVAIFWLPVQGSPGGNATNIKWDGGELFDPANPSGARDCANSDDQPFWMGGMSDSSNFFGNGRIVNPIIRNVIFNPAFGTNVACAGDPLHLERLRIDGNIDNLLIDKTIFLDGGNENTGTIFISNFLGDVPTVTFRNSYISGDGTAVLQNNTGGSCPWVFQYNTFTNQPVFTGCSTGMTYTGNVLDTFSVCQGTHTKNVFTGGLTSCGTDFKATSGLGLTTFITGAVLQPSSGSSAPVDRGESTCATTANGEDIRGYARSASCDAGAYEFGATGGSSAPTVTTSAASSITSGTATGNGNVTSDGGATITQRGVCWSTSANPTTAGTCSTAAGTTGAFTASMTGLSASTLYHYRAYGTNSVGTSYGADTTFTTSAASSAAVTVQGGIGSSGSIKVQ